MRLFVVAQLFLERGLYTAGLKGHDYSKSQVVSGEEARSVLEFWGVDDPRKSLLLMHLSELYSVCEARTYCTPLVRQATANCLCMEMQIAHPLVQLPSGSELKQYYCPLIQPYLQGQPQQSPQRVTLMWTVATSDQVRDISVMAALDEHVDFNHWCVLYRKRAGQIIRPYEYVPLTILFPDIPEAYEVGGDADDPDCEVHDLELVHPLHLQIENVNLLPYEGEEDELSGLFSVAADENSHESVLNDIMGEQVDAVGVHAGARDQTQYEEDDDDFAAAVPASQPLSNTRVAPTNQSLQIESQCAWFIKDGDKHDSATDFHVFVQTKYCKERQFLVRKESTVRKAPNVIPEGFHPPDGIYAQNLVCTLAGVPRKKKEGVPDQKRRERKSLKVGCKWCVRGKWEWEIKKYVVHLSHPDNLVHTNGCNPTPQQHVISITKTTSEKLQRIPLDVLADVEQMFDEGQPISFIRARIRNRIPLHIKTDARWFMNLRVTLERQKAGARQQSSARRQPHDSSDASVPAIHEDATIIPKVLRSIIAPILRLQGLPVLNILKKLTLEVPGFMYEYVVDSENQLAGWCYMTPRQRASLEDNGHVLFFDTNAKGTNKYGMPFFAPAVMNQDNKHDIVLYGCCCTASGEAIGWVLSCMCKMVPAFRDMNPTVFSDDACPELIVAQQLPGSTHLLCAWHIIDLDIYNCGKECDYFGIDDLRKQLWGKVMCGRSVDAVRIWFLELFESSIPELLKQRMRYWFSKINRWGGPHIRRVFTANFKGGLIMLKFVGKCSYPVHIEQTMCLCASVFVFSGNSMGEVSFAAVLRWVTRVDDFTKLLCDTLERERVLHIKRNEEFAFTFLNWRANKLDHFAVVAARASISDYGCHLFAKQLRLVSVLLHFPVFA